MQISLQKYVVMFH